MIGRRERGVRPSPLARLLQRAERALRAASPAHILVLALAGLALFLLITVPLVAGLGGPPAAAEPAPAAPPAAADRSSPGSRAAGARALEYLSGQGVTREAFTTFSVAQTPGSDEPLHIWELALPEGRRAGELAQGLAGALIDPGRKIEASAVAFDSKTAQVTVVAAGQTTHNILISDLRAEIVPGEVIRETELQDLPPPQQLKTGPVRVAIIIDDIGYRPQIEAELLALPQSLSFAVLPGAPNGAQFAEQAHAQGRSVLLHLPLEPLDLEQNSPGPGALFVAMPPEEIERVVLADLAAVPYIEGVNNHMGSRFTQEPEPLRIVLQLVRDHGLYFVDSLTTGRSQAFRVSHSLNVPTGRRDVFLDHTPSYEHVLGQLRRLGALAQRQGFAVGIGHPYEVTLAALRQGLPELQAQGVLIVPMRELVY